MAEELIPIVMFIALAVVICFFFWFRYKARGDMQKTFRTAIDKGQELTPEIIDRLGNPPPPQHKDLRLALIWLALAIGLALFGFSMSSIEEDVLQVMLGISAFPTCIGLAYLIMWRFTGREQ